MITAKSSDYILNLLNRHRLGRIEMHADGVESWIIRRA
jgi:hypothetical protein